MAKPAGANHDNAIIARKATHERSQGGAELDASTGQRRRRIIGVDHDGNDAPGGLRHKKLEDAREGMAEPALVARAFRIYRVEALVHQAESEGFGQLRVDAIPRAIFGFGLI